MKDKLFIVSLYLERQNPDENIGNDVQHTLDAFMAVDQNHAIGIALKLAETDGNGGLKNGFVLVGYQVTEITKEIIIDSGIMDEQTGDKTKNVRD